MNTKEKADALIEKFYNAIRTDIDIFDATKLSILSVEHTIEVMEAERKSRIHILDTAVCDKIITEQTELLTELKSRI
jgi:hypothetical protein